ncbi:hypothetical protein [Microbacter margulisiae]|uniref:Outer membrane protein beta-barrel domain-containing protein n=1 Tax=Microbacter margulisiae TaxID=1350067 RepID=A0A7W5GZY2_9PORP|nr:hypothetical protein [Microbacter margulisiae]MBB3185958.1 hypothetical protein [Microbacter margulisiae]
MYKKIFILNILLLTLIPVVKSQSDSKWAISLYSGLNSYSTYNVQTTDGTPHLVRAPFSLRSSCSLQSDFDVGYLIDPIWEIRGQLGWENLRWDPGSGVISMITIHTNIDLMYNLKNYLYGYYPDRLFDYQFFVGAGYGAKLAYNHTVNIAAGYTPIIRGGIVLNFHLNEQFAINGEISQNLIFDHSLTYNLHYIDNLTKFSLGFTYYFGVQGY